MQARLTKCETLPHDAVQLAMRMRAADLQEVRALIGAGSVTEALRAAVELSPDVHTYRDKDMRLVFMLGCAEGDAGEGQPWMLATDLVAAYPVEMTRETKRAIRRWKARWPRFLNYVDARHTDSIRWLRKLGFKVHDPLAMGVQGEHFCAFTMEA